MNCFVAPSQRPFHKEPQGEERDAGDVSFPSPMWGEGDVYAPVLPVDETPLTRNSGSDFVRSAEFQPLPPGRGSVAIALVFLLLWGEGGAHASDEGTTSEMLPGLPRLSLDGRIERGHPGSSNHSL